MADILSLDDTARVAHVLNKEQWEQLGGRVNQPLEELRQKLGAAFDDEMLQQLREHAARANIIPVPHAFETRVQRYDFKHPARLNKTQMRTLENLHENFARLLGSTFSAAMRQVVNVDTAFVDQTTYREFIMSLSNPSSSYQFTLAPRHGQVIMDIAMPVSFALVDSAHGGKGSSAGLDARQLSQLEMGVLAKVVRRAVEDLEATWEGVMPEVNIHDIELETNPEFMQIAPGNEIVLLLAFEVNTPNVSALISLCYPFFTLEPIMHRFGVQTYGRRSDRDRRATRQENRLRLGGMELPVVAELGRAKVATKEAASLQVGDVVRLQTRADEPACVYLGGRPKFHGYPYAEQGRLQLQIAGRVPPQFAEGYGQVRALDVPEIPERRTVRVLRP